MIAGDELLAAHRAGTLVLGVAPVLAEVPPAAPVELRQALAALLPGADPAAVEKAARLAEAYALALLGGRHPSCARWLPLARSTCGLTAGHLSPCASVAAVKNQRMRAKKRAVRLEALREAS